MRINRQQHLDIKKTVHLLAGSQAIITLFGSRVDDSKKGEDIDILVKLPTYIDNPALLAAKLSVKISNLMFGRKVDVLLEAPNLDYQAIHKYAHLNGIIL